jgi:hypothetical protein
MPVTNIKFIDEKSSNRSDAVSSVKLANSAYIIYNSHSDYGILQVSNSSGTEYDMSGSAAIRCLSINNSISCSYLTYTASNITESGTNFISTKQAAGTILYATNYFIKSENINFYSNNIKLSKVGAAGATAVAGLLFTKPTSGYTEGINVGAVNNFTVYYDGTTWNELNLSLTSVNSAETCSAILGNLAVSNGGSGTTVLKDNSILIGSGTNQINSSSLSYPGSGYIVISDGNGWKPVQTSSIQLSTETSSYLKPQDFDLTSISFTSSSVTQQILINSTRESVEVNINADKAINLLSSGSVVLSANGAGGQVNFKTQTKIEVAVKQSFNNDPPAGFSIIIPLNKPVFWMQGTTPSIARTGSLNRGLYDGQVLTILAYHRATYLIKCSNDTGFASPELSNGYIIGPANYPATQLRYSAALNKWFRHF